MNLFGQKVNLINQEKRFFRIHYFLFYFILFLFTGYAYLNARNIDVLSEPVVFLIFFLATTAWIGVAQKKIPRSLLLVFSSFLGLTLASVLFPPSEYSSIKWFARMVWLFILAAGIVVPFAGKDFSARRFSNLFFPVLCVCLATAVIVDHSGSSLQTKEFLSRFSPLKAAYTPWNEKYSAYWLLFLAWMTMYIFWGQGEVREIISLSVLSLSFAAIFMTSAESAQLAAILSLGIFILAHIPFAKGRYQVYLSVFLLFLIVPLMWVIFSPLQPGSADSIIYSKSSVGSRVDMYDFCARMVKQNFLSGYGVGSCWELPVPESAFRMYSYDKLPGGHPHNIVFLFFLELGFWGFAWLAGVMILLFNYIYDTTRHSKQGPAIWALVMSAQVIFSFSFSIWQFDVVLIYAMFFFLLFALLPKRISCEQTQLLDTLVLRALMIMTVIGITFYVGNSVIT